MFSLQVKFRFSQAFIIDGNTYVSQEFILMINHDI